MLIIIINGASNRKVGQKYPSFRADVLRQKTTKKCAFATRGDRHSEVINVSSLTSCRARQPIG